jgi:hypothetical protein
MSAATCQRSSRWGHAPIRSKDGTPRVASVTERDIEGIFRPLSRYRYLPADYIHAFAGGSLDYLINRLSLLSREPNRFVSRPHQQRANAGANHRRLIYELADKGWALMQERGALRDRTRAQSNFAHELMASQLMASVELGARESAVRLISWPEILQSRSLPDATRSALKPSTIPVTATTDAGVISTHVAADGLPFGIARPAGDKIVRFFCPGIEADCGTEPVDTSDFQRSSLYRKFVLYLAVESQSIHRSHFGFPNLYVPIVTTNAARLASMMRLLERITGGAGAKNILFKTFPAFTSPGKPPPPSGLMLTEDWQRVGHPPFNFLTS